MPDWTSSLTITTRSLAARLLLALSNMTVSCLLSTLFKTFGKSPTFCRPPHR